MKPSSQNKRIVCLWFPDWPVQRLRAARPELARAVLLLTETNRRGELVAFRNRRASRRGIAVGMSVAEARSLVFRRDAVHVEPMQPEADRTALEQLALRCGQYSPCAGLEEAEPPQCLLLDITGVAHLFGGEHSLTGRLRLDWTGGGYTVRVAVGGSVGAAWAAAHFLAQPGAALHSSPRAVRSSFGRAGRWAAARRNFPPEIASAGNRHDRPASRPRSRAAPRPVWRRDQPAAGSTDRRASELIVPCRPAPRFQVEHFLEYGVKQPAIIDGWLLMLLQRLAGLLQERRMGTRRLQCTFVTERKSRHDVAVRLCQAVADARHLGDLLRLNLERLRFDAPLVGIRMEALENSRLEQPQGELFAGPPQDLARQLSLLLDRMSSRLGTRAVARPRLLPEAVPERAFEYVPATETYCPATAHGRPLLPLDRPTCLFPQPQPVEVMAVVPEGPPAALFINNRRQDVLLSRGPERIESGWWQGPHVRRDYYHVETAEGRRWWLFRRLQDGKWFVHGGVY